MHLPDRGMSVEPAGDRLGVAAVGFHADRQGLQASEREVGVHRAGHGADRVDQELEALAPLGVASRRSRRRSGRSVRRGTSSRCGRRRRPRARSAAAVPASRTCCRPRPARRPRGRRLTPPRCRRSSACGLDGVSTQTKRVSRAEPATHRIEVGQVAGVVLQAPRPLRTLSSSRIRAAVDVVAEEHVIAGAEREQQRSTPRRSRSRTRSSARRPRGRRALPRTPRASGCRRARSPRASASRPRPARTSTSGRSGRSPSRRGPRDLVPHGSRPSRTSSDLGG